MVNMLLLYIKRKTQEKVGVVMKLITWQRVVKYEQMSKCMSERKKDKE